MIELVTTYLNDPGVWIAFLTLCALEVVLGIDNIIFISVIANRLPVEIREQVRRFGLLFALLTRILLLLSLSWVMGLNQVLLTIADHAISGRDLILLLGGFFLIWKASKEIYTEVEVGESHDTNQSSETRAIDSKSMSKMFISSVVQIGLLDIIFSLDSVITAVGMVDQIGVMIAAVLASVLIMLVAAKPIGDFVHNHPSIKVLALSFLTVVGVVLIAEGMGVHIPKGYVYVAMAFSLSVELLNIRSRKRKKLRRTKVLERKQSRLTKPIGSCAPQDGL